MKIIKISHGENFFSAKDYQELLANNLACVHKDTPSKGRSYDTQFDLFINASVGDVLYICNSNKTIDAIGVFRYNRPLYFNDNYKTGNWVCREFFLLYQAVNPGDYDKENNKWWMPRNNSTCTEVGSTEHNLFEKEILKPVFEIGFNELLQERNRILQSLEIQLSDIINFQHHISDCFHNEDYLLKAINNLAYLELRKQQYDYANRKNIQNQPVVKLRNDLVEILISNGALTNEIINSQKEIIDSDFEKNVFHAWRSNFRVLYPMIYDELKPQIIQFFKEQIISFQNDLSLAEDTNYNLVDFDGAQNQGRYDLWFAIYNRSHKNQKYAKQLFLKLGEKVEFGLLSHMNPVLNKLKVSEQYDYNSILEEFLKYKNEIIQDNINIKQKIFEMIDLLEYKKQIILQGPPGTGKTREAKLIAKEILGLNSIDDLKDNEQFKLIQFHPSYTYEDFVRGIVAKPNPDGEGIIYEAENKTLGDFATKALDNFLASKGQLTIDSEFQTRFNTLIDEINSEINSGKIFKFGDKSTAEIISVGNEYLIYSFPERKEIRYKLLFSDIEKVYNKRQEINIPIDLRDKEKELGLQMKGKYPYYFMILKSLEKIELPENFNLQNSVVEEKPYILIIDEINRANLSSVLGELIYALEYRGKAVESMYSVENSILNNKNQLILPDNLYIIGTMNTADRSVGHIDYAIRRRFAFVEVLPKDISSEMGDGEFYTDLFSAVKALFTKDDYQTKSDYLSQEFEPKDVALGHSYFIDKTKDGGDIKTRWNYEIKPILLEYIRDGVLKESALEQVISIETTFDLKIQ